MIDKNTAAYCLVCDGLTQTAILSPTLKPGERRKVRVRNSASPFDELIVDSWITDEGGEKNFHFEDGHLGHAVTFSFNEAVRQMLLDD